jgi:hypothetical protein
MILIGCFAHYACRYKRGAMQRAVLLLSYQPYFDIFEGFLRMAMMKYWQQDMDNSVIAHVYETVNSIFAEGIQVCTTTIKLYKIQRERVCVCVCVCVVLVLMHWHNTET